MAYETSTSIPAFKGLMQYGDGINGNPSYATEEKNLETIEGVLQPAAACTVLAPELEYPIETLMLLHRRWYTGPNDKNILVAASHGKLYSMLPTASEWTELGMPDGVNSYASNRWSWVTYEINPAAYEYDPTASYAVGDFCRYPTASSHKFRCTTAIATPEVWNSDHWLAVEEGSVDVLLISNASDGMYMVRGDIMSVSPVTTPKKFAVIERYAERIWGGAIMYDPDMLVYSAPYDPTDWSKNQEIPEDGAGDLNQPSWDGDSFTALRSFGSQLIAFKRTRVWRVLGTNPGEYTFKEQYGGGAPYYKTIAVDTERIFMLTENGVAQYDGMSVTPFRQQFAKNIWARMNKNAMDQATATLWNHKYYCALPLDSSTINNAVIIYDTIDDTWLLREDVSVESFLGAEDGMYFTSSTTPGRIWQWKEDSWKINSCTAAATRWVSPWNDLGSKNIVKGGFELYFLAEVKDSSVTFRFSIQTEKKIKTKAYTVQPGNVKQKRLHFGGAGRRFRLIIETPAGSSPWRLVSGIMIISEIDQD